MAIPLISNPDGTEIVETLRQDATNTEQFQTSVNEVFKGLDKGFNLLVNKVQELVVGQKQLIDFNIQRMRIEDEKAANQLENRIEAEREIGGGADATEQPKSLAERIREGFGAGGVGGFLSSVIKLALAGFLAKLGLDKLSETNPELAASIKETIADLKGKVQSSVLLFNKDYRNFLKSSVQDTASGLKKATQSIANVPSIVKSLNPDNKNVLKNKDAFIKKVDEVENVRVDQEKKLEQEVKKLQDQVDGKASTLKSALRTISKPLPFLFGAYDAVTGYAKGQEDFQNVENKKLAGALGSTREVLDGFVFQTVDFLKDDIVGNVAKFLGFEGAKDTLESFSASKAFRGLFDAQFLTGEERKQKLSEVKDALSTTSQEKQAIKQQAIEREVTGEDAAIDIRKEAQRELGFTFKKKRDKRLSYVDREQLSDEENRMLDEKILEIATKRAEKILNLNIDTRRMSSDDLSSLNNKIMETKNMIGQNLAAAGTIINAPVINNIITDNSTVSPTTTNVSSVNQSGGGEAPDVKDIYLAALTTTE